MCLSGLEGCRYSTGVRELARRCARRLHRLELVLAGVLSQGNILFIV